MCTVDHSCLHFDIDFIKYGFVCSIGNFSIFPVDIQKQKWDDVDEIGCGAGCGDCSHGHVRGSDVLVENLEDDTL
ncbi:hypothetical protein PoB_003950300 [Plakobranchus ocellatus]|uniref:Uncharacterized protein n=1 Tax=Plakobranchus ocellatus TaxID=259542 RepID=A0AAV4B0A4_9GAST|nr:hypothetical protein PoB_003950300 [Plakobranchus ocellatus]